ncbi:MAG TPA: hypothetical protein VGR67_12270 [Candidatus Polarisedimenticolia bacterium]|nr:hypothetical protein [Candidatus Polarisedimenticolia bacterium]
MARLLSTLVLVVGWSVIPSFAQTDTSAPNLAGFSFSPASIDTTDASRTVTVTFHVTDNLSGVASARAIFANRDVPSEPLGCESAAPQSGTALDGTYVCQVTFPRFSSSGTWQVSTVELVDQASNQTLLSTAALAGMGFPTDLQVWSAPDTAPPLLTGFNFVPRAADASQGPVTVQASFHATDDRSGIAWAKVTFVGPPPAGTVLGCTGQAVTGGEPALDVVLVCNAVLPQGSAPGVWTVYAVETQDAAGNLYQVQTSNLPGLGFPSELNVTTQPDVTPPSLSGFSLSPSAVDAEAGGTATRLSFTAADDLSGVASVAAVLVSPGSSPQSRSCASTLPDSSPSLSGAYHCDLAFPADSPEGVWKISQVVVSDAAAHNRTYATADLSLSGFPVDLSVGFLPGAPRALVEQPAGGLSIRGDSLTVAARLAQGSPAGISATAGVRFEYRSLPFGSFAAIPAKDATQPNPDTTYPYVIHWDLAAVADGDYELRAVAHGGSGAPDPSPVPITVHVTAGGSDIEEHVNAQGLQESRTAAGLETVTAASGSRAPRGGMTACEFPAGSLEAPADTIKIVHPDPAVEAAKLEQPAQSIGVFVDVALESGQTDLAQGLQAALDIGYPDADGNGLVDGTAVREQDLELARLDTVLDRYVPMPPWAVLTEHNRVRGSIVRTGRFALIAPVEAKIRFLSDVTTLTWDPLSEASSYHVYRGALTLLRDTNADGLPDGGYGECRDFLDPVQTDLVFSDAGTPAGSGAGWFYLVTFQTPGGEKGAGNTSQGLTRTLVPACP